MNRPLHRKVGIAAVIMMGSVFLSRFVGLFRDMAIAYVGGLSGEVDAYHVAFLIPEILNHIVASGFLAVTFIPIFTGYLASHQEDEGWRIFSIVLTCFGSLLVVLIALGWIWAPELIETVARGRRDPQFQTLAVQMTRIIMPAQFFFFAGGLFMAVQFAKEQFVIPALAPLIYNLGIIAGGIALGPWVGMQGFSWGVLIGAFAGNFALQYWGARRAGMRFRILYEFRNPDLKKYILLTLPLMFGLTMMFSMEIFMRYFGSFLPPGSIAGLLYGRTILFIPVGLFGQAAGMAAFPFMARLIAEKKIGEMNQLLNRVLRYLALVIPFAVLLMVLRHEIVRLLFQRGHFDAGATDLTAQILVFLLPGAFALSSYTVVVRGYHATQNTLFPALFGSAAVLLSLPLYWYGMQWMGASGIALAVSVSAAFQVGLLYALWNAKSDNVEGREVYRFYLKIIVISAALGALLEWFKQTGLSAIDSATVAGSLAVCAVIGLAFFALLLLVGYGLRIGEIAELFDRLFRHRFTGAHRR
ncbi:MAG: virulence factor MviN [Deltaproteobacteria bacterium SG8_13]|nr:MAG: virulence factor MviN [Deltaproteobacteria bacterium SG8_13]